jgi:hypothetical protein
MGKGAVALVVLAHLAVVAPMAKAQVPGREYSCSVSEARKRRTLISEVEITPSSFKWQQTQVSIGQAWIEKCKDGGCYLCFRIESGKEAVCSWNENAGFFVLGDEGSGVRTHHFRDSRILAVQYLESLDLSNVRMSFVGSFKERRLKNFRVARKAVRQ